MQLTKIEAEIVEILSRRGRTSYEGLAVMLGITRQQAEETVTDLERAGVIAGYPAIINWNLAGCDEVEAIIEIRVSPVKGYGFDALAEQIMMFDQVESVYLMSGAYDLMVRMRSGSLKELAMFVSETLAPIENVLSTATHFVLKKYKSHGVMLDKQADKRQAVSL